MPKLIVVLGATGGQGGSIVDTFLQLPGWRVRGVTRNANSPKAQALSAKGVELAEANLDDQASLERAFQGASAIFAFTDYYDYFFHLGPEKSMARELEQGSNLARAAATIPTLERYVWSTLPNTDAITKGQAIVPHFHGKANVDAFIKENLPELYKKTTFVLLTIFAANLTLYEIFRPIYLPSAKKWVQFYPVSGDTPYPSIGNHRINVGIFVQGIIENPPLPGTYVKCNVEDLTIGSFLAAWGRSSGISPEPNSTIVLQISMDQYIALWGEMGEEQASQWRFFHFLRDAGINPSQVPGFTMVAGKDVLSDKLRASLGKAASKVVYFGSASGPVPPLNLALIQAKNVTVIQPTLPNYISTRQELEYYAHGVLERVQGGRLKVQTSRIYSWEEVAQAHKDLEERRSTGKLLLKL